MLVTCYRALGDEKNARRIAIVALERAEKAVAQDRSNGTAMVTGVGALAALGEVDRARDWMRRTLLIDPEAALRMLGPVLERDAGWLVRAAPTDPDLAGLRDDPRFQAMLATAEARLAAAKPTDRAGASESA
jgi:adenylate cyclase